MLFFYLYSTTFQWFSFHSWINSLLNVLPFPWKILILMKIVLRMIGENRQLAKDEPVEVQDFMRITDHFRGIYAICLKLIWKTRGCQHVTGWTCKH